MLRMIHVSDLHLKSKTGQNSEPLALLRKVHGQFDSRTYLLVTGDIADDGDDAQFRNAVQALSPFKDRLLIVPGNHDAANHGLDYSRGREEHFEQYLLTPLGIEHSFINKDMSIQELSDGDNTKVLALGLNSLCQTPGAADAAVGEVGKKQLEALDKILDDPQYEHHWRLVYLHHHPHINTLITIGMILKDRDELMAVTKNRADVLAFGHEGGFVRKATPTGYIPLLEIDTKSRPYRANANCSAHQGEYILIEFDGPRGSGTNPKGLSVKVCA